MAARSGSARGDSSAQRPVAYSQRGLRLAYHAALGSHTSKQHTAAVATVIVAAAVARASTAPGRVIVDEANLGLVATAAQARAQALAAGWAGFVALDLACPAGQTSPKGADSGRGAWSRPRGRGGPPIASHAAVRSGKSGEWDQGLRGVQSPGLPKRPVIIGGFGVSCSLL